MVTIAAVGAFASATRAGSTGSPTVVADRALRPGQTIDADDLRLADATLPAGASAFHAIDDLIGRAVLGPIGAGEVVQGASVSADVGGSESRREVALALPRERLAVGRLRVGDRVDVFVTTDDGTRAIVQGAEVVDLAAADEGSLTSGREVSLVVGVRSGELVAALVHALRTGEVTVVRSTFTEEHDEPLTFEAPRSDEADG